MKIVSFLIKEYCRILFKKEYRNKSDLVRGINLYRTIPCKEKKSIFICINELIKLFKYWDAYPDTYFRFGMFLKNYKDMERMKSFIPQGAYYRYSSDVDTRYHILIDDKILFHDILSYYKIPVPERFFIFRGNEFRKGTDLLSDGEVNSILSNVNDDRIFVKRYTGGAASGISIFKKVRNGVYADPDGDIVCASLIRSKYHNQDFIFEKQIIQEPILSQFNPDTVNTIRVLTYKNRIISATVRFGGKGEYVDNVSANGVAVSLDIETGQLGDYGMKMYTTIKHYYKHPDSDLSFKGTLVTQWPAVKNIVEKTLKFLPYFESVGFDVATTCSGPVILEINTGAGVNLSQMGKDYGIANYFKN